MGGPSPLCDVFTPLPARRTEKGVPLIFARPRFQIGYGIARAAPVGAGREVATPLLRAPDVPSSRAIQLARAGFADDPYGALFPAPGDPCLHGLLQAHQPLSKCGHPGEVVLHGQE